MLDGSAKLKKNINDGKPFYGEADVVISDGTQIHFGANDFLMSNGFSISSAVSSTSSFDIGSVIIGQLKMQLQNFDGRYNQYSFDTARVVGRVCSTLEDDTVEKIQKGIYTVVEQNFNNGIVVLTAYDSLYKLDTPYLGTKELASAFEIVSYLATKHSIMMKKQYFNNSDFKVKIPDKNYTERQVLSYILQVTGNYCYIDEYGYMVVEWYNTSLLNRVYSRIDAGSITNPSDDIINAGYFADSSSVKSSVDAGTFNDISNQATINTIFGTPAVAIDDVVITGVSVVDDDGKTYMSGSDGYVLSISGNPLADGQQQIIANNLANIVVGMKFRPLTVNAIQNPLIQPGDVGVVFVNDVYYATVFTNIDYTVGTNTKLTCAAKSPEKNSSNRNSVVTDAFLKSKVETEKQLSSYDIMIQQLTNLMSMSFGVFKTEVKQSDGSVIYYMHNKPKLADSSIQWKMTSNAFAVSTDGGKTWNAGLDSQGNAIVNVLSAIGINFDWAKGGTLTLGGENNVDGLLKVFNSSGIQIASLGADGIYAVKGTIANWNITEKCFEKTVSAYVGPSWPEIDTIRKHLLGQAIIPESDIYKYDFNGDGKLDIFDVAYAKRCMMGIDSYENCPNRILTSIKTSINPSNPTKLISITGTNAWGRKLDQYFGANDMNADNINTYSIFLKTINSVSASLPDGYEMVVGGDVYFDNSISASGITDRSARKYKENIVDITEDEARKLLELEAVKFDFIDGNKNQSGFIADDVEKIFPNLCSYTGLTDNKEIDGLKYNGFIGYIIKMIQMQEQKINALEDEIKKVRANYGNRE